eukprot:GHVU01012703.1.p3 GENE.GHVU01012703.1~~GHVU01012703.1.p3  ORF type:complete len:123 (+),score=15.88 GHVU01012703.1:952-1320(+)
MRRRSRDMAAVAVAARRCVHVWDKRQQEGEEDPDDRQTKEDYKIKEKKSRHSHSLGQCTGNSRGPATRKISTHARMREWIGFKDSNACAGGRLHADGPRSGGGTAAPSAAAHIHRSVHAVAT